MLLMPLMLLAHIGLTIVGIVTYIASVISAIIGVVLIIVAIIMKFHNSKNEHSGKEVRSVYKKINNIIMVVGVISIIPLAYIHIAPPIYNKINEMRFNNLTNKIIIDNNMMWRDDGFLLNGKKVILSKELTLPNEKFYSTKKEVVAHLLKENEKDYSNVYQVYKIENPTGFDMFMIEAIGQHNSNQIHIYEDDYDNINNYYADLGTERTVVTYVDDKHTVQYYYCEFPSKDFLYYNSKYEKNKNKLKTGNGVHYFVSMSEERILKEYEFIKLSADGFYTNTIKVALADLTDDEPFENRYVLLPCWPTLHTKGIPVLSKAETEFIQNILDEYLDKNEYEVNDIYIINRIIYK